MIGKETPDLQDRKQGDQLEAVVVVRAREESCLDETGRVMRESVFAGSPGFLRVCGTWESRGQDDSRLSQIWGIKDCYREDFIS